MAFQLMLGMVVVHFVIFMASSSRRKRRIKRPDYPPELWKERFDRADAVIKEVITELPDEIRIEAERVPCLLNKWHPSAGVDIFGLYEGMEEGKVGTGCGPIHIFIGAHIFHAREDAEFDREIRKTYLHELGHHLGLDEGDVDDRGLQ